jgi:hypothetical protein
MTVIHDAYLVVEAIFFATLVGALRLIGTYSDFSIQATPGLDGLG